MPFANPKARLEKWAANQMALGALLENFDKDHAGDFEGMDELRVRAREGLLESYRNAGDWVDHYASIVFAD